MKIIANSPKEYISQLPEERAAAVEKLCETIRSHMPKGLKEQMSYGMIGFVVPHEIYPAGYHCDTKLPLPFVNVANQKNFVALYHMGMYANPEIHDWFVKEYPNYCKYKLDMGKSCVRFKKTADIPYKLIAELMQKMSVSEWIELYEEKVKR